MSRFLTVGATVDNRKRKKKKKKEKEKEKAREMREEEESGVANFGLPEEVLEVLPSDPFEQLDVARKITSIALSMRVSALESESSALRAQLSEKDALIAELQSQIESLDAALSEKSEILARADQEKVQPVYFFTFLFFYCCLTLF